MDKLSIVDAVFDHIMNTTGAFVDDRNQDIQGYAIGYKSGKAIRPRKNERYAIVIFVDPDLSKEKIKALPKKIKMGKAEIPHLAGLDHIPKNVTVHVRVEKRRPMPVATSVATPQAGALPTEVLTGGDPLFSSGILLGTAGYVFRINGVLQLVSNHHVLVGAGIGNFVNDETGTPLARVTALNPAVDSGFATLEPNVTFSSDIPGIGTPTSISPGIDLDKICKKRGASTGLTEFRIINKKGTYQGIPCVIGVNIQGENVPAVGQGDSGSIVVGQNNEVMALVFRGDIQIGNGPNGPLLKEIWAIDISRALPNITLP